MSNENVSVKLTAAGVGAKDSIPHYDWCVASDRANACEGRAFGLPRDAAYRHITCHRSEVSSAKVCRAHEKIIRNDGR